MFSIDEYRIEEYKSDDDYYDNDQKGNKISREKKEKRNKENHSKIVDKEKIHDKYNDKKVNIINTNKLKDKTPPIDPNFNTKGFKFR